jgi:hypothetical protein
MNSALSDITFVLILEYKSIRSLQSLWGTYFKKEKLHTSSYIKTSLQLGNTNIKLEEYKFYDCTGQFRIISISAYAFICTCSLRLTMQFTFVIYYNPLKCWDFNEICFVYFSLEILTIKGMELCSCLPVTNFFLHP